MNNKPEGGTLAKYITGFILSILLTFAAYYAVQIHVNNEHSVISHEVLIPTILTLAVVQLVVQLWFFLHLGSETGPRWKLHAFTSTIALVLIVVVASIWIMNHLNYNMTPDQVEHYLEDQQGGF